MQALKKSVIFPFFILAEVQLRKALIRLIPKTRRRKKKNPKFGLVSSLPSTAALSENTATKGREKKRRKILRMGFGERGGGKEGRKRKKSRLQSSIPSRDKNSSVPLGN